VFTIIYNEQGFVENIVAGNSNYETLLKMGKKSLVVDELPQYDIYRQILKVSNNELIVENLEISLEREKEIRKIEISNELNHYLFLLSKTDYKTLKYIDGEFTEEEYAPIKQERIEYRKKIRELEKLLSL
jgi:hypothetical protein